MQIVKATRLLGWILIGTVTAAVANRLRRRISLRGKVVFITGGSRGLGLGLAREFVRQGAKIAIVARDEAELAWAKKDLVERGGEVWTGICDLTDAQQIQRSIDEAVQHFGTLDVLVNNAGQISVGPLETMKPEDFKDALAIHLWAPFFTMNAALPHLRGRSGRIVNIVSVGGKLAIPHLAPYCTSKFALAGLSDAYRVELAKDDIAVTTVFPGLMRTGSHLNASFKGQHEAEFDWFSLSAASPMSSISAARAARKIVEACRIGQPQLIVSMQARMAAAAASLFPNLMGRLLATVNRFLPSAGPANEEIYTGWDSRSGKVPPFLTRLADRATEAYNGLRGHAHVHHKQNQ